MTLTIIARLTIAPGMDAAFRAYEHDAMHIFAGHGGRVLTAFRAADAPDVEVHVLQIDSADAFQRYRDDPRHAALAGQRATAILDTQIMMSHATIDPAVAAAETHDDAWQADDAIIVRALRARASSKESRYLGAVRVEPAEQARRFGGTVAMRARHGRRVVTLTADELDQLDEILEWVLVGATEHTSLTVEVPPVAASKPVLAELARRGYVFTGPQSLMGRLPGVIDEPLPPGVTVERVDVTDPAQLRAFAELFLDGFGLPEDERPNRDAIVRRLAAEHHDAERWRIHIARVDGQPAALGSMFITDGIGWFANGAADPAYRRRGAHRAVCLARLKDAVAANVDLVSVDTGVNSAAQRNLHRVGFRLLAHYSHLSRPTPPAH